VHPDLEIAGPGASEGQLAEALNLLQGARS